MRSFMEAELNIKEILVACFVPPEKGTSVHRNRLGHGFAMFTAGESHVVFETGERFTARKNHVVFFPKGSNYTTQSTKDVECFAINFDFFEPVSFEPFLFLPKNPSAFLTHFKEAESIWRSKKFSYELKCKIELYNILYCAKYEHEIGYISKSKGDIIQPAIDYIHKNYAEGTINVADLAQQCGISETYFRKLFLKSKGISPSKYVNDLRIKRAEELIQSDLYTVKEVSELVGYKDESYFSRAFKKALGSCPTEYKERIEQL